LFPPAIDLSIVPNFRWEEKIHGGTKTFFILFEDVDGEIILFHNTFVLRQRYAEDQHNVTITVPMFEPAPPNIYISVVSVACRDETAHLVQAPHST